MRRERVEGEIGGEREGYIEVDVYGKERERWM